MKMYIKLFIGLIVIGLIAVFVIKKLNQKKTNENRVENKVLLIDGIPILKQFGDLTSKDFDEYPIWVQCHIIDYDEKWYDDTDEETFRPWIDKTPVSPGFAMFLIRSELTLSDGGLYSGFITPCLEAEYKNENDLGLIQPQIFTKTGKRIGFWTGMFPLKRSEIDEFYTLMNVKPEEIFPIDFKINDSLSKGITSGRINGFLTIGKDQKIIITK